MFSLLQVIHSAAIYTIALVTMIGTYVSKSNAQYIALDALPPIIGIVVGPLHRFSLSRTYILLMVTV